MNEVDVIAVVGSCAPERRRYARRLAERTNHALIPALRLAAAEDPAAEAAAIVPWTAPTGGAVVEFPSDTPTASVIGALADEHAGTRLTGVVCVLDASHLLDDLARDDYVSRASPFGVERTARALITASNIELASEIVLVNWEAVPTSELSTLMALVSHLGPSARLRLDHGALDRARPATTTVDAATAPYAALQERPGWVAILNDDFEPHMSDPRVSAFRYECLRPLHPGRLHDLLDGRIDRGEFGTVIRSAGFCRLATRPGVVAVWEHVGHMFELAPLRHDDALDADDELLALGQDLAFIGLDLDRAALARALDETALADDELAAGPAAWARFDDPFPAWRTAPDTAG